MKLTFHFCLQIDTTSVSDPNTQILLLLLKHHFVFQLLLHTSLIFYKRFMFVCSLICISFYFLIQKQIFLIDGKTIFFCEKTTTTTEE